MKFYFCEACGKRLTEHDIEGGVAKNKKLKGVFCNECAVGVTTMESLPMTDDEAKQVLEGAAPRPPGSPQRPARRSSRVGLPRVRKGEGIRTQSSQSFSVPSSARSSILKLMVPAIVVVMLALVGLVVLSGGERDASKKVTASRTDRGKAITRVAEKEKTPRKEAETGPAASGEASVEPPGEAESPEARHSPLPKPDAKATPTPDPVPPESRRGPEKVARVAQRGSREAEPAKAPPKPNDTEVAKAKFRAYLKAFDEALAKDDLATACKAAGRAASETTLLKPVAKEAASLGRVGQALSEEAASWQRARAALTDGKKRTFQTSKESVTGVVRKIEDDTLRVRVVGRINRQVIEYEKRVKLVDLTPGCRARLLPEKAPATSDAWLGRTAQEIASRNLHGAEEALARAGAHPLATHYRQRLKELRLEKWEEEARRCWEERIVSLTKVAEMTKAEAVAGQKELYGFWAAYGQTSFALSITQQAKAVEKTFQVALGRPTDERFVAFTRNLLPLRGQRKKMGKKPSGSFRDNTSWLLLADKPPTTVEMQITRGRLSGMELQDPKGEILVKRGWKSTDPSENRILLKMTSPGIHRLILRGRGYRPAFPKGVHIVCEASRTHPFPSEYLGGYIYVPKGTETILAAPGTRLSIQAPSWSKRRDFYLKEMGDRGCSEIPVGKDAGKVWSVIGQTRGTFFFYNIPPYVALDPEQLLVPAELRR